MMTTSYCCSAKRTSWRNEGAATQGAATRAHYRACGTDNPAWIAACRTDNPVCPSRRTDNPVWIGPVGQTILSVHRAGQTILSVLHAHRYLSPPVLKSTTTSSPAMA